MVAAKTPEASLVISRRLVMPDQLNPNGSLFGGELMAWIDMTAFMCAERHAETSRVVTASVDRLEFLQPLRTGDHVLLTARVEYVGRTSMAIEVEVEKEISLLRTRTLVALTHLTFVALDDGGKPMPVAPLEVLSPSDRERHQAARVRAKVHQRYRKWRERTASNG